MAIKIKVSPEADARAAKHGLWLGEITMDSRHTKNGGGGLRMTGAISKRIHKKLTAVMCEWIREEKQS